MTCLYFGHGRPLSAMNAHVCYTPSGGRLGPLYGQKSCGIPLPHRGRHGRFDHCGAQPAQPAEVRR